MAGWFYVGMMGLCLVFNLSYLVGHLVKLLRLMARKYTRLILFRYAHKSTVLMWLKNFIYREPKEKEEKKEEEKAIDRPSNTEE